MCICRIREVLVLLATRMFRMLAGRLTRCKGRHNEREKRKEYTELLHDDRSAFERGKADATREAWKWRKVEITDSVTCMKRSIPGLGDSL